MSHTYATYEEQESRLEADFTAHYELQGDQIVHPDPTAPRGDQQIVLDRGLNECRYCERTKADGVGFKKAHVIPEQMGNKLIVSDAECTPCNETFSVYETHLGELLGPLKTLLGVEGKSKKGRRVPKFKDLKDHTSILRSDTGIHWEVDPERTTVRLDGPREFSVGTRHLPYVPLLAWKGIARCAVHLLALDELDSFQWFREAVSTDSHDQALAASTGLACVISTFLPSMHNLFPQPELRMFNRRAAGLLAEDGWILPEKMFVVKAASHVYQVPVYSDADIQYLRGYTTSGEAASEQRSLPLFPVHVREDFVENYDVPKRSMLSLNSLEEESPINWIQMRHTGPQPLSDEQMLEAGLTEEEIQQVKTDGLTGEAVLKWLASVAPVPRSAT
ncbi:MAG: hypothetical protein IAE99_01470 [Rhodothermales bacterium]|nr:hypothetical protein [Rhodothermales bacterium]